MLNNMINNIQNKEEFKKLEEEKLNKEIDFLFKDFIEDEKKIRSQSFSYEEMKQEIVNLNSKYKEKIINLRNRIEFFK